MSLLPRSLFRRLVLLLLVVLVTAQVIGLAIHLHERSDLLREASGMQSARRIIDIVRLLDSLQPDERQRIVAVLGTPSMRIRLDARLDAQPEAVISQSADQRARALLFGAMLQRSLGDARTFDVAMTNVRPSGSKAPPMAGSAMSGPEGRKSGHAMKMSGSGPAFLVRTRLADGMPIAFDARPPPSATGWPLRMLASLAILLLSVLAVSLLAVRWVIRPLGTLADAADELGRNIHRPPLVESGPVEVVRAARAFNTMQTRLSHYLQDRTRFLAAMSHDLKTPITRLRLRAELLDDPDLRARFTADLAEMEAMVSATLEFMRGADAEEPRVAIDLQALLQSLEADFREAGGDVRIDSAALKPYVGRPRALKRCLTNLLQNAIQYGGVARVGLIDAPDAVVIRVCDDGPGIPEAELERVFEPYYRLESSRSRDTGGTGLGLAIARAIARAEGGDISLGNRREGGLEAVLRLPRAG